MASGGYLTTHVLDTASGQPASGLALSLYSIDGNTLTRLGEFVTNADGRCDTPLLQGEEFNPGTYELQFETAAYFADNGLESDFLSVIPIRFGIADAAAHYHVPLLLSPYGYSTYRGS